MEKKHSLPKVLNPLRARGKVLKKITYILPKNHKKIKKSQKIAKKSQKKSKNHKKSRKNQKITEKSRKNQKISYTFFKVLYPSPQRSAIAPKNEVRQHILCITKSL